MSKESDEAPPYASFFGSMGSAAAIIFTGTAEMFTQERLDFRICNY